MSRDFKALKLIHLAISGSMIFIFFMVGRPTIEKLIIPPMDQETSIFLVIAMIGFFLSKFLFKYQLKQADPKGTIEEKFHQYRIACLTRWGDFRSRFDFNIFCKI